MHKQILPIFSMGILGNRIKNNTLIVDLKKEKKELYLGICIVTILFFVLTCIIHKSIFCAVTFNNNGSSKRKSKLL